jgi:glucose-6-phosphate isomerase
MGVSTIFLDPKTGLSPARKPLQRRLSQMKGVFSDAEAYQAALAREDSLVYEFYDLALPSSSSEIAFGTSMTFPGKIGNEYFMTKGHFHSVLETAEVYYCLRGNGYLIMENPEGEVLAEKLHPGVAVYVRPRFAHRSVNVSPTEPLVTFFAFRADAGHDYGTIEENGFRLRVVEEEGKPVVIESDLKPGSVA